MTRAYLDHNATAPLRAQARAAVQAAWETAGNPSSVHTEGRAARKIVENARAVLAAFADVPPSAVIFTGGATEANALALAGRPARRLLVSSVEHPSIREAFPEAVSIPVGTDGRVAIAALEALLAADPRPALVAVMAANNETGILQPLAEVRAACDRHGALLHVDAVQAAGRVPLSPIAALADSLSLSAHKIGGPTGVGALILREDRGLVPLLRGGGQERSRRAGTENVAGIAGFAAAVEALEPEEAARLEKLRNGLENAIAATAPETVVIGREAPRLGNTSCLALPGASAETLVMALDLAGFAVSAGSACSSGKVKESAVLRAMGLPPAVAGAAVRISLGWTTSAAETEGFAKAWAALAARRRDRAAAPAALPEPHARRA
jgi:cysteine desulfurase